MNRDERRLAAVYRAFGIDAVWSISATGGGSHRYQDDYPVRIRPVLTGDVEVPIAGVGKRNTSQGRYAILAAQIAAVVEEHPTDVSLQAGDRILIGQDEDGDPLEQLKIVGQPRLNGGAKLEWVFDVAPA